MSDFLDRYITFFESLTASNVSAIRELVTADMHFRDPFNDVVGVEKVEAIFRHMFTTASDCRFTVLEKFRSERAATLRWEFSFRPNHVKDVWLIDGMSYVALAADGRIAQHIDYWDAASYFYEKLPVLGTAVRLVKRRLAVT